MKKKRDTTKNRRKSLQSGERGAASDRREKKKARDGSV